MKAYCFDSGSLLSEEIEKFRFDQKFYRDCETNTSLFKTFSKHTAFKHI